MGIKIEDGVGGGKHASVSVTNRLNVSSKASARAFYISRDSGNAYSWTSSYSAGTGEEVIYVKNTHASNKLFIDKIHVGGVLTGLFELYQVTGTAAGTTITGKNLNLTSSNIAAATALGNASVTSLTIGDRITLVRTAATATTLLNMDNTLILGFGDAIAITYTGSTGIVDTMIRGYYEGATL